MTDREIVKSAISRGTALRPLSSQRRDGSSTVELINCASVPRTGCNLAAARNFQKKLRLRRLKNEPGLETNSSRSALDHYKSVTEGRGFESASCLAFFLPVLAIMF